MRSTGIKAPGCGDSGRCQGQRPVPVTPALALLGRDRCGLLGGEGCRVEAAESVGLHIYWLASTQPWPVRPRDHVSQGKKSRHLLMSLRKMMASPAIPRHLF